MFRAHLSLYPLLGVSTVFSFRNRYWRSCTLMMTSSSYLTRWLFFSHLTALPLIGDVGSEFLIAHHLPHVLNGRIWRHHVVIRQLKVLVQPWENSFSSWSCFSLPAPWWEGQTDTDCYRNNYICVMYVVSEPGRCFWDDLSIKCFNYNQVGEYTYHLPLTEHLLASSQNTRPRE